MNLLVTTNARLYKAPGGKYWTPMVYGYSFFKRYLEVFENVILVAHCEECSTADNMNWLRVDGENLTVYEVPFPHGKTDYIKRYFQIKKVLKKIVGLCDAAILRIPDQLAFQIYPLLQKHKVPIGVEVTSDSWEFFDPRAMRGVLRPFLRIIWHINQKKICKKAVGTAYVTKFALQKRYPPMQAILKKGFTTNYTDTDIYRSLIMPPREYTTRKDCYTAIHVSGSISGHAKGHKELIEAVGILATRNIDIKLVLVGAGDLSEDVKELIRTYKIQDRIHLTGRINDVDILRSELNRADIFVFPSYREGLPRVVVEAMACALPCVASDLPGLHELLDESCMVPVQDAESLANKLQEVLTNPERLTQMSKLNVEKVYEYCMEEMSKKRKEFYLRLKECL